MENLKISRFMSFLVVVLFVLFFPSVGWAKQDVCPQKDQWTSQEVAISALIKYGNGNPCFKHAPEGQFPVLTPSQMKALKNSLELLAFHKFIIVDGQIIEVGFYDQAGHYQVSKSVSLGLAKNKVAYLYLPDKQRIPLFDLGKYLKVQNCSKEKSPFITADCMIRNFAKKNPHEFIGENKTLLAQIEVYLEKNISGFKSKYKVLASYSTFQVLSKKPQREFGFTTLLSTYAYHETYIMKTLNGWFHKVVDSNTDNFAVISTNLGNSSNDVLSKTEIFNLSELTAPLLEDMQLVKQP